MLKKMLISATVAGLVGSFFLGANYNAAQNVTTNSEAISSTFINVEKPLQIATVSDAGVSAQQHDALSQALAEKLNFDVQKISVSAIPGLYEVVTEQGIFYVNADASNLIQGTLYQIVDNTVVDLTEQAMAAVRKEAMAGFAEDTINYPAENEKYSITVFTDINCGYCRKLHSEMAQYNALGISVKYLAFPRGGLDSQTYRDMVSIWCSDDKVTAMNSAKQGTGISPQSCTNNIAAQYQLGQRLGVTGTPAIVFDNGQMKPGYAPAAQLLSILQNLDKS
jgi:thiol:disulfide interchange protein DsbC